MAAAEGRTRSWWGWGWDEHALSDEDCLGYGALLPGLADAPLPRPSVGDVDLPTPRVAVPGALASVLADDPAERARHTYGRAYRDVVRKLQGRLDAPPDLVALPPTRPT